MNDTDNFDQALHHLNTAFVFAANGRNYPLSMRDFVLTAHIKHLLDVIYSPAFEELVREEERKIEAHAWVRETMGE